VTEFFGSQESNSAYRGYWQSGFIFRPNVQFPREKHSAIMDNKKRKIKKKSNLFNWFEVKSFKCLKKASHNLDNRTAKWMAEFTWTHSLPMILGPHLFFPDAKPHSFKVWSWIWKWSINVQWIYRAEWLNRPQLTRAGRTPVGEKFGVTEILLPSGPGTNFPYVGLGWMKILKKKLNLEKTWKKFKFKHIPRVCRCGLFF